MKITILNIENLTELVFAAIVIVLLLCLFILVNFKKIRKSIIVVLFISIVASTHLLVLCDGIFRATIEISFDQSFHMGLFLGLPALLLLTMGALLVLYNEKKYVLLHGYFAGSSWILSLLNVIFLISLTPQMILDYSGLIHSMHIIFGGFGIVTGFASMLFGVAAQRHIAKLTGYITLVCWWGAFLLSLYISSI
ncbi:MAG: hypothetical protein ACFFKA_07050 [Candidatus Thorarchaeota archaeon]